MRRLFSRAIPFAVIVTVAWMAPVPGLTPIVGAASTLSEPSFEIEDRDVEGIIESAVPAGAHVEIVDDATDPGEAAHDHESHDEPEPVAESDEPGSPDHGSLEEHHDEEHHDHDEETEPAPDPDDLVVGEGEVSDGFHTIGVTLDIESPVFLRVADADGDWQEWIELEVDPSEGPDTNSAEASGDIATPPVFVDDGQAYEIVVSDEAAEGADVVTVRDTTNWTVAVTETQAAASTETPFSMHNRAEWTSRAAREVNVASSVNMAVVHHTVNPNSYSPGSVPSMLRGIQNYHMDGRGWSDIGYNFVVDKYGGIWEARGGGYDKPVIGAHAAGFNTGSVGISVLGDFGSATPSAATNESIAQVAGWKLFRHGHDPADSATFTSGGGPRFPAGTQVSLPRMVGHTNVGSTACPGSIINYLPSIRNRAQTVADFLVAASVPLGGLEVLNINGLTVSATGWAIDPDLGGPARVDLRAAGITNALTANIYRPDLAGQHTAYSTNRGFSGSVTSNLAGLQDVCITVINQGIGTNDVPLSCAKRMLTDPSGRSPTGNITNAIGGPGAIGVSAEFIDPDTAAGSWVRLEIDGVMVNRGGAVGSVDFIQPGVTEGWHEACVVVEDAGPGVDARIDCATVYVEGTSPVGTVEISSPAAGWIRVRGWALDQESVNPIDVAAITGPRWDVLAASLRDLRSEVTYPAYGPNHGFDFHIPAGLGVHDVCVAGVNVGGGLSSTLGCQQVIAK